MSSILRTGKFLRCLSGLTRNIVVNTARDNENVKTLTSSNCICQNFQHGFANVAAYKTDLNLDQQLRRIDNDVRRSGRISRRDIEEVLEEIRAQRSATSSQSLLMIRCCGNLVPQELPEVRTALVHEIWKTLNTLKVPMDISHYNALLRVYLENEHEFTPTDFLAQLEANAIEPNRVTYQRLIARYCAIGDIEGATRILEFMREKKLPVNENVFNSLILGHSQANDMESSKGILGVMKQAGLEPSADTYTTLLCCYAKHGDLDAIMSTIKECEKQEIFLLDKDLLDVVYHLTINGHGDKIENILNKLRLSMGFNQDAVNLILRLTNKGYEDDALKILYIMPRSTRADGQLVDTGGFFIKQLVKLNRPVEKILKICKSFQDNGLNPKALLIATEAGLTKGMIDNSLPFLKELRNSGLPIRQHYFWPLICSAESNKIVDIIRHMQEEFAISPNSETLRDYVIPNMKEKNWNKIFNILRDSGISAGVVASSTAYASLMDNKMEDAAKIMESFKAYYAMNIFRQPLLSALSKTDDYTSFVRIVRQIYESSQLKNIALNNEQKLMNEDDANIVQQQENAVEIDANESEANDTETFDIVGASLIDIVAILRHDRIRHLEKLLPAFIEQGLSISNQNATRISERLGSEMTLEISEMLDKLSSGELQPKPLPNMLRKRSLDEMNIEELERFIVQVETKGDKAYNIKRHLLNACFRSKKLEKTVEVIEKLEAENYNLHSGVYAQLIDLYAHNKKTTEALELYDKMKAKDATFVIDNLKTLHIVDLLIQEDRFDDAIKFLDVNKKVDAQLENENTVKNSYNYNSFVWRLLCSLADAGNSQNLQRLFDALESGNYIMPTNVLLGPLIKVHLVRDDLSGALESFEKICEKYKATPWKNEIACRLIQKEDAVNLQKLTDLSTSIHGEVNSLYDLVFSFVECGRIRQARKILETPGMRTRPHRISTACERYQNEGLVEPLEGLIEATKDMNHIDRDNIYYNLLLSYCKTENDEKALGLWTKMQEEDIAPNDLFLIKLAALLKSKNMQVPFAIPNIQKSTDTTAAAAAAAATENVAQQKRQNKKSTEVVVKSNNYNNKNKAAAATATAATATNSTVVQFRKALNKDDIETAIKIKNAATTNELNKFDVTHLIEHLVRAERITEATKYVNEMLDDKLYPKPQVFKFYLNKLASSGDIETIQQIGSKLTEEVKRLISYDNRLCHANVQAGKSEQFLKQLLDQISNVKSAEEAMQASVSFPRGGAFGIFENSPETLPIFQKIAEKYAEYNIFGPMNVLWMHLLTIGDEVASKQIWDKYLSNAPRLMFQRILQTAREQKDEKLVEKVIGQIRESKVSEGGIGNAYSCLIDIYLEKNNSDKALTTLQTALKDISLENINRTALMRLKTSLVEQNKEFPYELPEKKVKQETSSSSSSASSDEDVGPIRPETVPKRPDATAAAAASAAVDVK